MFVSLFSFHSNYFSPSVRNDNIVVLFISDWGTGPQSKEVTPEQDIPEEESTPGVLVERFPKESSSECEDSLKNQQENHEKHLIQEVGPQTKPSGREATSVMNLEEILVGGHYLSNSKERDDIVVIHLKRT